jgi:hypothetical protein
MKHPIACMSFRLSRSGYRQRISIERPVIGFVRQLSRVGYEPAHPLQVNLGFVSQISRAVHEAAYPIRTNFGFVRRVPHCFVCLSVRMHLPAACCLLPIARWLRSRDFWWGTWPLTRSLVIAIVDSNPTITAAIFFGILDAT